VSTVLSYPTYAVGGWVGNTLDDAGVAWIIGEEIGWAAGAPLRRDTDPKEYDDGDWDNPGFLSGRLVTLNGTAVCASRAAQNAAKDTLLQVCSGRALTQLVVAESHMARQAMVRLGAETKIADVGPIGFKFSLILYAPDPRRYATAATSGDVTLPTAATVGGRTYGRTYPLTYSGTGGLGSYLAVNTGTYSTPIVFTIYGPITNPSIEQYGTGRKLEVDLVLGASDYLVLDTAAKTVLLNGATDRSGSMPWNAAWFNLAPGTTELRFRGTAGAGGTPRLTTTFTSAWN
jgi:hypothetical protein